MSDLSRSEQNRRNRMTHGLYVAGPNKRTALLCRNAVAKWSDAVCEEWVFDLPLMVRSVLSKLGPASPMEDFRFPDDGSELCEENVAYKRRTLHPLARNDPRFGYVLPDCLCDDTGQDSCAASCSPCEYVLWRRVLGAFWATD